ncbi:MAG: helix-turn-helix transcriptional regulator [Saprospiraceae bacterium]|nr:helix-turn-helix transcriptional regulator [Saprospiraceae bacterium]
MDIATIQDSLIDQGIPNLWHAQSDPLEQKAISLPFLQHEIILNLGDTFEVSSGLRVDQLILSPIQANRFQTSVSGRYEALGVLFNPIGIYANFGLSVREFRQARSLDDVLFGAGKEFLERLATAPDQKTKLRILVDLFVRYGVRKKVPQLVHQCFQAIHLQGSTQIQRLARDIDVSSKHLRSSFKDVVGISPKTHLQLLQLHQVVQCLATRPNWSLTEIALRCGFYDQSHFIRKFRQFAGMTPRAYRHHIQGQQHHFYHTLLSG